jgi:5-(carboxyamino)imidazole ribonucleotide mutase
LCAKSYLIKNLNDFDKINIYSKIIWVIEAGRSNALSGVVASNTKFPVIACPPFSDKLDMIVNIQSTLQCPSSAQGGTVLEPINVAIAIKKIFLL